MCVDVLFCVMCACVSLYLSHSVSVCCVHACEYVFLSYVCAFVVCTCVYVPLQNKTPKEDRKHKQFNTQETLHACE